MKTNRDKDTKYIDCFHFELTEKLANELLIPFKDITFDICKREGEDETLESWREGHIKFFSSEGNKLGYTFTEDMPVIFEDFKVVFS